MRAKRPAAVLAVMLAVLSVLATRPSAGDIVGTWVGVTEVPDQGPDTVTMIVARTESGYAVVMSDSLGVVVADAGTRSVAFEGDTLTFLFTINDGSVLLMRLKLAGEKLAGQWEHPEGTTGAIVFERKL